MDELKKHIEESCLVEQPAFCTAACPFGLNIPDFTEKLQRGGSSAAYRTFRNAVAFPDIVARLCDAPCTKVCPHTDDCTPINLPLLERAAIDHAPNRKPNRYNVPKKTQKIAVIGAGISGLACAMRFATMKYDVTVYEKTDRIGGHLWDRLDPEIFLTEIEREFSNETYALKLNHEVTSLDTLDADAVYITTGAGGTDFGFACTCSLTASERPGVFLGGSLCGSDTVRAIADGLQAATVMEQYLKTGVMTQPKNQTGTLLDYKANRRVDKPEMTPKNGLSYTKEEAALEAGRCLRCSCDACKRRCDMMDYYKKLPPRIAEEVYFTIHPSSLWGKETFAKRMMETCNQCSACKDACPRSLDLGELIRDARGIMRRMGKQPWVFHDFWLRDMEHAVTKGYLARTPNGTEKSGVVYFPGCQLGGSDPRYVLESYRWIKEKRPDAALWLSCCGVPAIWAGDEDRTEKLHEKLRADWAALGFPEVIFACPTCKKTFSRYFPEMKGRFIYEWMAEEGTVPQRKLPSAGLSVFDPCRSRDEPSLQEAVRILSGRSGAELVPLPEEGKEARCCSWGGHVSIANPDFAEKQTNARITQSGLPYIAYCANCRDIFADAGKECIHIFDLLFNLGDGTRPAPGCTERQVNREKLKNLALNMFWDEQNPVPEGRDTILVMDEPVRRKLSADRILEDEAAAAAAYCEKTGRMVIDQRTGSRTGSAVVGRFTIWVTYRPEGEKFRLLNAYSHRMRIRREETWNGKRTNTDL